VSPGVIIVIDLVEERVILTQPGDFTSFSVAVQGDGSPDDLAQVVHQSGLGHLQRDGSHLVVDPIALRSLAGATATPEWDTAFEGMQAYAAGKGWVEADGGILAHIERRDDES
jgi:hypothetical protein